MRNSYTIAGYAVGILMVVFGTWMAFSASGIDFTKVAVNVASFVGFCIGVGVVGAFLIGFVVFVLRGGK